MRRTRMLMSPEMKLRVLLRLGVDAVIQQTFSPEFARIAVEEFLPHLRRRLPHLAGVYVGENWRFGAGRRGDVHLLLAEAARHHVSVLSVPRIQWNGEPISSTRIRDSLEAGRMEEANMLLGYSYFAEGVVTPGRRLGRTIGLSDPQCALGARAQAALRRLCRVRRRRRGRSRRCPGWQITVCGRPSAEADAPLLEAHLLGPCPFAAGSRVTVEWLKFLRPERKFESVGELRRRIAEDRAEAEAYFRPG